MKMLDKEFVNYLRNDLEMSDNDISTSTPNELFSKILVYEGYGSIADFPIKRWIKLIYNIDLNEVNSDIIKKERL